MAKDTHNESKNSKGVNFAYIITAIVLLLITLASANAAPIRVYYENYSAVGLGGYSNWTITQSDYESIQNASAGATNFQFATYIDPYFVIWEYNNTIDGAQLTAHFPAGGNYSAVFAYTNVSQYAFDANHYITFDYFGSGTINNTGVFVCLLLKNQTSGNLAGPCSSITNTLDGNPSQVSRTWSSQYPDHTLEAFSIAAYQFDPLLPTDSYITLKEVSVYLEPPVASFVETFSSTNASLQGINSAFCINSTPPNWETISYDNPRYYFCREAYGYLVQHNTSFITLTNNQSSGGSGSGQLFFNLNGYINETTPLINITLVYGDFAPTIANYVNLRGINTTNNLSYDFGIQNLPNGANTLNIIYNRSDIRLTNFTIDFTLVAPSEYITFDAIYINPPQNIITPNVTPNVSLVANVFYNETFRNSTFYYNACQSTCPEVGCIDTLYTPADNYTYPWYCYNSWDIKNDFARLSTSDTTKINTPKGLQITTSTIFFLSGDVERKYVSLLTPAQEFDLKANDTISFTCSIPDQGRYMDAYLYLGPYGSEPNSSVISLGSYDNSTRCLPEYIATGQCCDLGDIIGNENTCVGTTKRLITLQTQAILDNCPNIDVTDLENIRQVGLWVTDYGFWGTSNFQIDDILIKENIGLINSNQVPTIVSVWPSKNPVNVSEQMTWQVGYINDDNENDTYIAFSCGGNATIDYSYGNYLNYGLVPNIFAFNCTYNSPQQITAVAYITDATYSPYNITNTGAGQVSVEFLLPEDTDPRGGDCDGFAAPFCVGDCRFFDDFSYDGYSVNCNGWTGTNKHPRNAKFTWDNMNLSETDLRHSVPDINSWQYRTATFGTKITLGSNDKVILNIGEDFSSYAGYLLFENGVVTSIDNTAPNVVAFANYNLGETYTLSGEFDFLLQEVTWTLANDTYNASTTAEFFDTLNTINHIEFSVSGFLGQNYTIDDVLFAIGEPNFNGTAPINATGPYTYNATMFCAIDWSLEKPRFSYQNCLDRGYSSNQYLASLCLPRACIDDTFGALVIEAQKNILSTIIIIIGVILIAPLIVMLLRRR